MLLGKGSGVLIVLGAFKSERTLRTDKGLFITMGTFTKEAIKESTRDGAPAIDLVDGDQLV